MDIHFFYYKEAYNLIANGNYFEYLQDFLGEKNMRQGFEEACILAQVIQNAGDGNHIEIGTFHGGSAFISAYIKEYFGLSGFVYCVDPRPRDIEKNALTLGLYDRIKYIESVSNPFPAELSGIEFVSGYIDGDHRGDYPMADWINLSNKVSKYIIFDDYSRHATGVIKACKEAFSSSDWIPVLIKNSYVVLEHA